MLLGAVYRGTGQYAEAEAPLQRAVRLLPEDYETRYNLGFVLARLGRPQEALAHLKRPRLETGFH